VEIGAKLCFLLSWKFLRQEFPTAKGGAIGGRGFTFVAGRHGLIGPGATEACHWTTPLEHVQCRGFPADKLCFCHLFSAVVLGKKAVDTTTVFNYSTTTMPMFLCVEIISLVLTLTISVCFCFCVGCFEIF
jgi:hypothetical protein